MLGETNTLLLIFGSVSGTFSLLVFELGRSGCSGIASCGHILRESFGGRGGSIAKEKKILLNGLIHELSFAGRELLTSTTLVRVVEGSEIDNRLVLTYEERFSWRSMRLNPICN
jgi:hypothetical protein